jgi:hypothetical protein
MNSWQPADSTKKNAKARVHPEIIARTIDSIGEIAKHRPQRLETRHSNFP